MSKPFDYLIIGSGFAGSVVAERIANVLDEKVLVIEKRNHIGGNCYDCRSDAGINVHRYGPPIFHTDYKDVYDYLSNFTDWRIYHHKVLGFIDGKYVPIPFNLNSLHMLFPEALAKRTEDKLITRYGYNEKAPIL
jgi:UDP-galactopyranose mutase